MKKGLLIELMKRKNKPVLSESVYERLVFNAKWPIWHIYGMMMSALVLVLAHWNINQH